MSKDVFVEPSASGPTQKLVNDPDGTVHVIPGKAHEAQEGRVTNPGVRTAVSAQMGPQCPVCHKSGTLKMHSNKPEGQRVYCSDKDCRYDTAKTASGMPEFSNTTEVKGSSGGGVKVLRQSGPNN